VRKVSDCHGVLLFHVGEEWSLVVDLEVEYTMLVREFEARGVDRRAGRGSQEFERKSVEG
jgi:hypothetical protein